MKYAKPRENEVTCESLFMHRIMCFMIIESHARWKQSHERWNPRLPASQGSLKKPQELFQIPSGRHVELRNKTNETRSRNRPTSQSFFLASQLKSEGEPEAKAPQQSTHGRLTIGTLHSLKTQHIRHAIHERTMKETCKNLGRDAKPGRSMAGAQQGPQQVA